MAKKKSKLNMFGLDGVTDIVKGLLATFVLDQAKEWVQDRIGDVQSAIYVTVKKTIESFLVMSLLIVGIMMILFSLPFMLAYYLNLPASLFFVFIGLFVIIVSLIAFHNINKTKYQNFEE